jgi:hypothetical protein
LVGVPPPTFLSIIRERQPPDIANSPIMETSRKDNSDSTQSILKGSEATGPTLRAS